MVFFIFFSFHLEAQQELIPLLLSDHHADHMEFFFCHSKNVSSAMIVVDAHTDTVYNDHYTRIRAMTEEGNYSQAGELAGNHNWIHPLCPNPVGTLVWISEIHDPPASYNEEALRVTNILWGTEIKTILINIDELRHLDFAEETLFISVDLDFFYGDHKSPNDVPAVLDALFAFSLNWQVPIVWAVCLSRPWLPDDRYAWTLLEKALSWFHSRYEFKPPEITIFNSKRNDTSLLAQRLRAEGREAPFLKEEDIPEHIKELIQELNRRTLFE